jgi:uncharacterized protein (DUF2141 family)
MKNLLAVLLAVFLLAGCASQAPQAVDNGKPGKIEVFIYKDSNGNGIFDAGEAGQMDYVARPELHPCSKLADSKPERVQTDEKGLVVFSDLKAGQYCVFYYGTETTTTKLQADVLVNSEETARVEIGLMDR